MQWGLTFMCSSMWAVVIEQATLLKGVHCGYKACAVQNGVRF